MAAPGLYLHIPFCSAICPYCDFSVLKGGTLARERFALHLIAEMPLAVREWRQAHQDANRRAGRGSLDASAGGQPISGADRGGSLHPQEQRYQCGRPR